MFTKLHQNLGREWNSNTSLALTNPDKTGTRYQNIPRLTLNTIVFQRNSKHLDNLLKKINPSQTRRLVENLSDLSLHMKEAVGLFEKVAPPDCVQFFVPGWVTSQEQVSLDQTERTVIGEISSYPAVRH